MLQLFTMDVDVNNTTEQTDDNYHDHIEDQPHREFERRRIHGDLRFKERPRYFSEGAMHQAGYR
jgi:hypothetical protein